MRKTRSKNEGLSQVQNGNFFYWLSYGFDYVSVESLLLDDTFDIADHSSMQNTCHI